MADPFEPRFVDLVRNYTTTQGTGNFVLGAPVAGYRGFDEEIGPGDIFYYSALGIDNPGETEVGRGTMQADGTISRQPLSGGFTSFTNGNKTVALVAASEWYEATQAKAGSGPVAVASRAALAALEDTSRPALLSEAGREGLFVFDPANRSASISADPEQGLFVAPASDPSGASGAWSRRHSGILEVRWFGALGDGIADDGPAFQAALTYYYETASSGRLRFGKGTFNLAGMHFLYASNVTIDAYDATLVATEDAPVPMLYMGGDRSVVLGGTWRSPFVATRHFDIEGRFCRLEQCRIEHSPDANTVQMYVRYGADGFEMINCHVSGANEAVFVEASDVLITGNRFDGAETLGGDDCIPIKAIQGVTENIRIIGNSFRNHSAFVSIGSQVGTAGANDPTYSRCVRNVVIAGNTGEACAYMLFIKPGSVSSIDYRDGTVEGIVFSDNVLYDLTGEALNRAIAITAARGCRVRNVKGRNNLAVGRCRNDSSGLQAGLHIFNLDFSSVSPGCGPPTISDIDIELTAIDPHNGAPTGGTAPGAPFNYGAIIENQTPTHGTMSKIQLDLSVSGTFMSGIQVGPGLDDAVSIRAAKLTAVNTSGSNSRAGIRLSSRIRLLTDEISISTAGGNPYRLENETTGEVVGKVDQVFVAEQINAGNDETRRLWAAPRPCFVTNVDMLSDIPIAQSSDDSNYTQFEFRNIGGTTNIFHTASSKLTGGQAFPANVYNPLLRARSITNQLQQDDCFFDADASLSFAKNDFGSGNTLRRAYLRVHWAPY